MANHVNSPRGAVQGLNFVWDIALLEWVPMQQPMLNVGNVTADLTGTGLALETTAQTIVTNTSRYTLEFDYVGGANLIYFGKAAAGTATASSTWQIAKFTYDGANNIISMLYAGGSTAFNKVWDNRAGYTYS